MSHLISIPLATCFQILARCDASDDIKRVIRDAIAEKMTELEKRFTPLPPPPGWEPVITDDAAQQRAKAAIDNLRPCAVVLRAVPMDKGIDTVYGIKSALGCTYATARHVYEKVRGKWDFQAQDYTGGEHSYHLFPSFFVAQPVLDKLHALGCVAELRVDE